MSKTISKLCKQLNSNKFNVYVNMNEEWEKPDRKRVYPNTIKRTVELFDGPVYLYCYKNKKLTGKIIILMENTNDWLVDWGGNPKHPDWDEFNNILKNF